MCSTPSWSPQEYADKPSNRARRHRLAAMRVTELILDGFKSYPVRTSIAGWDSSFNAITGLYVLSFPLWCALPREEPLR